MNEQDTIDGYAADLDTARDLFERYRYLVEDHYANSCAPDSPCYPECYEAWRDERDRVKRALRQVLSSGMA